MMLFQRQSLRRICVPRNFHRAHLSIRRSYSVVTNQKTAGNGGLVTSTLMFLGGTAFGAFAYKMGNKDKSASRSVGEKTDNVASTLPLSELEPPEYASDAEIELAIEKIRGVLSRDAGVVDMATLVNNSKEQLDDHSDTYFNSHHATADQRPKYVVYPTLTQQVSEIMKICHEYRIPVVPTSGKSSLEGHFVPTRGGICMDLGGMDKIIKLNKQDLDIHVEAGVGWETLADYLDDYGLLFSSDPGPGATISGICATNASGTNASRYGETYKNVINLTVVLADGTIVKTKNRPKKSSAGYNLNSLFVGSEGTLGIITEATLKLNVKPASESVLVVPFKSIRDAANSVNEMLLAGIQLNAIELLDDKMMNVINISGETTKKWSEKPTLFLKIGASNSEVVDSQIRQIRSIVESCNNEGFQFASDEIEKTELWSARKVALWSTINQGKLEDPNMQLWTTDAAVPISNLPNFLTETKADIDSHGLQNTLVAHIGDGNAHSFIVYKPEQREIAQKVVDNMVQRAIKLDGTCTGEHGIGMGKRDFLLEEIGVVPVDVMRRIKLLLDPLRILNPDKIFAIDPNDKGDHTH